jgi:hypothetical protein
MISVQAVDVGYIYGITVSADAEDGWLFDKIIVKRAGAQETAF